MTLTETAVLAGTGFLSGLMNSIAGGGSFLAFPVLMFLGLLPINANATSTVALWPGTLSTMIAYHQELWLQKKRLPVLITLSIIGGAAGAITVLHISNDSFIRVVPYLLLIATLMFTFRPQIINWIRARAHRSDEEVSVSQLFIFFTFCLAFILSVYNGFFGAGFGIMMLAALGLMGMHHMHEMNAVRSCCGLVSNTVALIIFIVSGLVSWPHVFFMAGGAVIGGYGGAKMARTMPPDHVRRMVIILGWGMTTYFFWKLFTGK